MAIHVTSTAFREGEMLPVQYTCDGESMSPPLAWSNVPPETESLVVICEDPDAPSGIFHHWLLFNLNKDTDTLGEDVGRLRSVDGGEHAVNSAGTIGYSGPCPPHGSTHSYVFYVCALDTRLDLKGTVTRQQLFHAMKGHVLDRGTLSAKYARAMRKAA